MEGICRNVFQYNFGFARFSSSLSEKYKIKMFNKWSAAGTLLHALREGEKLASDEKNGNYFRSRRTFPSPTTSLTSHLLT